MEPLFLGKGEHACEALPDDGMSLNDMLLPRAFAACITQSRTRSLVSCEGDLWMKQCHVQPSTSRRPVSEQAKVERQQVLAGWKYSRDAAAELPAETTQENLRIYQLKTGDAATGKSINIKGAASGTTKIISSSNRRATSQKEVPRSDQKFSHFTSVFSSSSDGVANLGRDLHPFPDSLSADVRSNGCLLECFPF